MKYLKNKHEKNSARITALIMLLIVLLLFFVTSPPYMDPPVEYGVVINFGNSSVGSGDIQPDKQVKSENNNSPQPIKEPTKAEPIEAEKPENIVKDAAVAQKTENVLTQESDAALAIKKQKEIADAKAKAVLDAKAKSDAQAEIIAKAKAEALEKKRKVEAAKKAKLDAIMGGLNQSEGITSGGEGDDDKSGDKGQLNGSPYSSVYFGSEGVGSGGVGYGLNGRGKPSKQVYKQDCNETGLVVVQIEVDRSGKVVNAKPGVKGTENLATCLLNPAKKIALSHKWKADANAPIRQIGFVSVNFKIGQ